VAGSTPPPAVPVEQRTRALDDAFHRRVPARLDELIALIVAENAH
jgi:hypothetical protein